MVHKTALILLFLAMVVTLDADIRLKDYPYPFPVKTWSVETQGQTLEMAYMDVFPPGASIGTVLLLHGKNFSGAYFGETAQALAAQGYRVILPDQIGFGKSSKPDHYQYSFHQLATNTQQLIESLGVQSVHVLGHSMGGMIATRFALMFPEQTASLTLLNPIGLEDWKAKGVPYQSINQWYEQERAKTREKIKTYQRSSYYDGQWSEQYDPWVDLLAEFIESPEYPTMAWNQALTYDMIYTQPVLYEFPEVRAPTLLIIGQRDTTALGKNKVTPEQRADLGNYPRLGRSAHAAIPDSTLVELKGLGHLPHIEDFERFFPPYLNFLNQVASED